MEKLTYVGAIDNVLALEGIDEETKEKLVALRASLVKKKESKKATKTQTENVGYKNTILEVLATVNGGKTISEIQDLDEELGTLSNQKVSALMRQLVESGEVVKTVDKKKSYFALATE